MGGSNTLLGGCGGEGVIAAVPECLLSKVNGGGKRHGFYSERGGYCLLVLAF